MRRALVLLVLVAVAVALAWRFWPAPSQAPAQPALSVMGVLADEADLHRFPTVDGPREFEFPADHGPHPQYRHEWWYLTGNLTTPEGRHFGYQVTFFRFNLGAMPARESAWATNQVYMAHFAVTDTVGGRFHHFERFSRAALGLAGAQTEPLRVWLDDWQLQGGEGLLPMQVQLAEGGVSLSLRLQSRKSIVLQGDRGYSRKGPQQGNASHYYSLTRLETVGELTLAGQRFAVSGESWLDREWGSSALGRGQVGWDWFSLQLDDQRELMFFHLRREDGSIDPLSHGVWVEPDGTTRKLTRRDVQAEPLAYWESPAGGARYPLQWRVRVPAQALDLVLTPQLHDQELRGTFRYWEGAVSVRGSREGLPVAGRGYMELTGYGQ